MKMVRYIFLIFILILNSCSKSDYSQFYQKYKTFTKFPVEEDWKLQSFCDDKFNLQVYLPTIVENKYLVMSDIFNSATEMIRIYDLDSHNCIRAFGIKGQGPGEFISCTQISYIDDTLMIYDGTLRRISYYSLKNVLSNKNPLPEKIKKISPNAGHATNLCWLTKDTLVATGIFFKNQLCYYNKNLDTIKTASKLRNNVMTEFGKYRFTQTSRIVKNQNKKKFAFVAVQEGDILELYDYAGTIITTLHGPDLIKPAWIEKKNVFDRISPYNGIASTPYYIYAIYSGVIPGKDWLNAIGKNIHVFDWDGQPIKKIKSEYRICDMVYSEQRNTMYTIYFNGEYFKIGFTVLL